MEETKRIGIIVEFNPFHNGHIYLINEIKKKYPNSYLIVVMSKKFLQRGEIAICSFEKRKEIALANGIDEVVELPFIYATQAAHIFANGAVLLLNELKIDILAFGSESCNEKDFYKIANYIKENEQKYYQEVKKQMKLGFSFPKSSSIAIKNLLNIDLMQNSNDILALEYIKAIVFNNLNIKTLLIKRSVPFHSNQIKNNITSATNIREMILNNNLDYKKYTPMVINKNEIEKIEDYYPLFQKIIINTPASEIAKIKMVNEGMENLFKKNIHLPTYEEFINKVNSKRYTSSRIKRVMLYIILNIKN